MREILTISNEWWETDTISKEKAKDYKRKIFTKIKETFLNYRQILVLTGLRRVGKTTVIYQLIEELLNRGIDPKNILYFSFDELVEDPLKILEEYSKITKVDWRKEKVFAFFDEIHKLKDWSSKIKILYDTLSNLKICVSGSASVMIESEAIKNLAGRFFSSEIQILTLQEFAELYFERKIDNFELYEQKLKMIFDDYIKKPFPEIVKWEDRSKINEYIKELVIEKIEKSDIPKIFGNVNISLLSTLTEIFMKDVGMTLNITSLAKDLGVHKLTLLKHIRFLEFGKLIRTVKNFRPSIRAESRKLKKIYPSNISLSYCFYPELSKRQILENLVISALNLDKYWKKNGREIDFLKIDKKIIPIEVKEKERIDRGDLKNLVWFMKKYGVEDGIIVYDGREDVITIKGKTIILRPILRVLFDFSI
ncbi:MAG: ATP-binding protein [Candidatus Aenigmarchaeota archaeon]|nr:ATP-binding protein [Candidatus Aenigmarchaeota archaeon]